MRVHHFFPRTQNIGDQFVQVGISSMVHIIEPRAELDLFDVNSSGEAREYGLTRTAIDRANREADFVIIGGSNLYEGALGWPWGVHIDPAAIQELCVPLLLVGIGTGSAFGSRIHKASQRARREINLLNDAAVLSWTRDIVTQDWLRNLGVTKAEMLGDPATYIFNSPLRTTCEGDHILIVVPPMRVWKSRRGFWKSYRFGRPIFKSMVELVRRLVASGENVIVVCNDPLELDLSGRLFNHLLTRPVFCPVNPKSYFQLLQQSRAVVSGRLHTAAVALSLGIPFVLLDVDQRTRGFINTYKLDHASVRWSDVCEKLVTKTNELLETGNASLWMEAIRTRDNLYQRAMQRLRCTIDVREN